MSFLQIKLNDELLAELQHTAKNQSIKIDDLIEIAIKNYLDSKTQARRYSFIGIGHSGQHRLSEQVEDILAENTNRREGWSLPK